MIRRQRINARLDVREVPLEKRGHIKEDAFAVRHGCIGMSARPRALAISSPRPLRKPTHGEAMPDIPGNAWQLPCTIGGARGEAGEGMAHVSIRLEKQATQATVSFRSIVRRRHRL